MFVEICNAYRSSVLVEKNGTEVNGKSIMGLMLLAVGFGSKIRVTATGGDAAEALEQIETLITVGFSESR
jgi:phosphocarrier protein